MIQLKNEIEKDNTNIELVREPKWLIIKDKRMNKTRSLIIITVKSNKMAEDILKKRIIFIKGEILKIEKYYTLFSKD